jgi:DNA-binding MarR family transcriptional regulator
LPREDLTPREKATLYGMVRYPGHNDRELSEVVRCKMSTVTSIRARLQDRGLCSRAMVPSLRALGAGVISVCYGGVSSGQLVDMRKAQDRGLLRSEGCDSFYALIGSFSWLELGAFRNYSDAQGSGEGMWSRLTGVMGKTAGQPCVRSYYPMDLVRLHNFFDHAPLLSRHFGIKRDAGKTRSLRDWPERSLTSMEKLVLYGLVKRPGASDKDVAEGLGVSRQAVARIRRTLVREGRLVPVVLPSLGRLGFDILAFFHFRLDARKPQKAREGAVKQILDGIPNIFALSAGPECIVLGAYCRFIDFEKGSLRLIRGLDAAGLLDGSPVVQTFLVGDTVTVKDHDYVPFVKGMLGLKIAD